MQKKKLCELCADELKFSLDPPLILIYNTRSALLAQLDRATAF